MCNSDLDMGWEWVWEVEERLHHIYYICVRVYIYMCMYLPHTSHSLTHPHTPSHILMHLTHPPSHISCTSYLMHTHSLTTLTPSQPSHPHSLTHSHTHTTPLHIPPGFMVSSQERLWKSSGATPHLWTWLSSFLTHTTSYQPAVMGQWRYTKWPLGNMEWGLVWYLVMGGDCYHGTWWLVGTVTTVLGDWQGVLARYLVMGGDCYHGTWWWAGTVTTVLGDGRGLLPWYLVLGRDSWGWWEATTMPMGKGNSDCLVWA